jgi:hypothetical protein
MASSSETASVAFLTDLASEPPLQHDSHVAYTRPLVLYIARVPGSRDVILTTVKPRQVTITAEDINSSLYYLHAHRPNDDGHSSGSSSPHSVERPPLPPPHRIFPAAKPDPLPDPQPVRRAWTSHPNYSLDAYESRTGGGISATLRTLNPVQSALPLIRRKPVPQSVSPLSVRTDSSNCYNSDAGRYLQERRQSLPVSAPNPNNGYNSDAGRYLQARWQSVPGSPPNSDDCYNSDGGQYPQVRRQSVPVSPPNCNGPCNSDASQYLQARRQSLPVSPPYPVHDVFPDPENWKPASRSDMLHPSPYQNLNPGPVKQQAQSAVWQGQNGQSITPISTTPTTPSHLPKIFTLIRRDPSTGQQWNVAKISKSNPTAVYQSIKPGSEPLDITMENSGYDKFAGSPSNLGQNGFSPPQDPLHRRPFRRTLQMEETLFATGRFGHSRAKSHEVPSNNYSTFSFQTTSPTKTSASAYSLLSRFNVSGDNMPRPKRVKQVYSFQSPWNGRCEFSSTIADAIKVSSKAEKPRCGTN